jgi:hypothetical protein
MSASEAQRSWIPTDMIPSNAQNIREAHDLDTNAVWLSFDRQGTLHEVFAAEDRANPSDLLFPRNPPRWWPSDLRGGVCPSDYDWYRSSKYTAAVNARSSKVYIWSSEEATKRCFAE